MTEQGRVPLLPDLAGEPDPDADEVATEGLREPVGSADAAADAVHSGAPLEGGAPPGDTRDFDAAAMGAEDRAADVERSGGDPDRAL